MPSASAVSSTERATAAAASAAVLQREGDLRADARHHHLRLGIGQQRSRVDPDLGGCVLAGVQAGGQDRAAEAAAVEVGHQPAGRAQQRRLARAREPGDDAELPRLDREADLAQRRGGGAGVAVGDALETQDAHGSIPGAVEEGGEREGREGERERDDGGIERGAHERIGAERGGRRRASSRSPAARSRPPRRRTRGRGASARRAPGARAGTRDSRASPAPRRRRGSARALRRQWLSGPLTARGCRACGRGHRAGSAGPRRGGPRRRRGRARGAARRWR